MGKHTKTIIGWITIIIALSIIVFWSYWGINEAFHEGWYYTSLLQNLSITFVQYLSIPIVFLVVSLIAMNYKKIGSGLFIALGIFAMFFFDSNAGRLLIFIPLLLFAFGFYFGEYKRKKAITISFIVIFLLIILSFGIPQLIRVENRFNDNDFGIRIIEGNEIGLTWAPQGVGFPLDGTNWQTALDNCARLNNDGNQLEDEEVNIWRLPSRDEIIRSMTRKNNNVEGFLDDLENAQYKTKPDKETPLWNPHSQVIYYWTSEPKDEKRAYLIAYNGYILDRSKAFGPAYQGYRCVKNREFPSTMNSKLKAIDCLPEQRTVGECIEIYQPVCGYVQVECIKAPCEPIKETFENSCKACTNSQVISYTQGECSTNNEIKI